MKPFTDDRLKITKRRAYTQSLSAHVQDFDNEDMLNLIARLEAAEMMCKTTQKLLCWLCPMCRRDDRSHADDCDLDIDLQAWLKSKGEVAGKDGQGK